MATCFSILAWKIAWAEEAEEMATCSSILAWKIVWAEEAARTSPQGPRLPAGPPPSPGQLGARVPPVADEDVWSVPAGLATGAGQRGMPTFNSSQVISF